MHFSPLNHWMIKCSNSFNKYITLPKQILKYVYTWWNMLACLLACIDFSLCTHINKMSFHNSIFYAIMHFSLYNLLTFLYLCLYNLLTFNFKKYVQAQLFVLQNRASNFSLKLSISSLKKKLTWNNIFLIKC